VRIGVEYRIEVMPGNESFLCRGDEYLIEEMVRTGCGPVHYGCYGGGCGVCKMQILSGEYVSDKRMSRAHVTEAEEKQGIVLICCVKPCSDLKIARMSE